MQSSRPTSRNPRSPERTTDRRALRASLPTLAAIVASARPAEANGRLDLQVLAGIGFVATEADDEEDDP